MPRRKRKAEYDATLIYMDEPQLLTLVTGKTRVLAIAVPSADPNRAPILAVTVAVNHWEQYLDGNVDLRFMFTFPLRRLYYSFDLMRMDGNEVDLIPFDADPPEDWLPLPRLFSSAHTHPYSVAQRATDEASLFIDGEWDMPEFGEFYQQYASVYSFKAAVKNFKDANRPEQLRSRIADAFRDRPFKGGFSYVHFYNDLNKYLPRDERIGLDRIQYASPGHVEINGDGALLDQVRLSISNYLARRSFVLPAHNTLKKFLTERHYLTMAAENYVSIPAVDDQILGMSRALNAELVGPDFDDLVALAAGNPLVVAKLTLSFFRRVEEAATFFAEGRMAFAAR